MSNYYTYIVRCADDSLYTGFTTDLNRRVMEHNGKGKNGAKYTCAKRPVKLVYYEVYSTKALAMSREWHIKQLTKREKEKLIKENKMLDIVLASGSPRRKDLLKQVGINFEVITADVDEITSATSPSDVVMDLSRLKANAVYSNVKNKPILAADTVVAFNDKILGKPKNEDDAFSMLKMLSGNIHEVYTGVTIIDLDGKFHTFYECTKVKMYDFSDDEILSYINTKEPLDKAGAYGIQGLGATLVEKIDGDYNNVVGLPVSRVYKELKALFK